MSLSIHAVRPYHPEDREEAERIWREVKWLVDDNREPLRLLLDGGRATVGTQRGSVECLAITTPAKFRYLGTDLSMSAVMAVTTSLVARKQGLAGQTTAAAVRESAEAGATLSALGIFDQGYYDRLGFGTMPYTRRLLFDPAQLMVPYPKRPPHRFDASHSELLHRSRLRRARGHGSVNLLSPNNSRAEAVEVKSSGGLGYYRSDGEIGHHLYGHLKEENGPYRIWWAAYENYDELRDLLGVLRSLADQIHLVDMMEPRGVVLQDFLKQPFKFRRSTEKGKYEHTIITAAASQLRILDIPAAVAAMGPSEPSPKPSSEPLEFNLLIDDPIERQLPEDGRWRGCSGSYVVQLGADPKAEPGDGKSLPKVRMSIGGFTQLWSGARKVAHLSLRGELDAESDVRDELSRRFRVPEPDFEWLF